MAKIPIPHFEKYSISKEGNVFSGDLELKTYKDKRGYHAVYLYDGHNNRKYMSIHRLVMLTYSPIDNHDKMTVNHRDGNKNNNALDNLEWMTNADNIRHSFSIGLRTNLGGKKGKAYAISKELINILFLRQQNEKLSTRGLAKMHNVCSKTLQYQFNLLKLI